MSKCTMPDSGASAWAKTWPEHKTRTLSKHFSPAKIKCRQFTFLQTLDMFKLEYVYTFVQYLSNHSHVTCLLPDHHMRRWVWWWWSYRWEALKPMTAAQDCILTLVGMTPLDIFKKTSGHFPDCGFVTSLWQQNLIFWCVCDDQNSFSKPKHACFLTLTRWFGA